MGGSTEYVALNECVTEIKLHAENDVVCEIKIVCTTISVFYSPNPNNKAFYNKLEIIKKHQIVVIKFDASNFSSLL